MRYGACGTDSRRRRRDRKRGATAFCANIATSRYICRTAKTLRRGTCSWVLPSLSPNDHPPLPPRPPSSPPPPLPPLSLSLALRSPPAGRAFVGTRACVCREARKCVHTNTRWRDRLTFRARQKYAPPRGPRINRSLWLFCRRAGMRARTHVSLSHTHYDAYISRARARLCVACACVLPSPRHATVTYLSRPRRQCRLCAARGDRSGSTCAQPAAQRWCWRPCRTR